MTKSQVVAHWLEVHRRLSFEADAFHDSQAVAFGMLEEYDSLSTDETKYILPTLAEWLVSDDSRLRYDASFLVSQRSIREMIPALQVALTRCKGMSGPEARYEFKKLRRIIDELRNYSK